MKKIILSLMLPGVFVFSSCKKTYTCECTNPNNTYIAGDIDNTKRKAKKSCEQNSTADTRCYIK